MVRIFTPALRRAISNRSQQITTQKGLNDLLPPEKLVKLLEYLHILVSIPETAEYFIPCVFQTVDVDNATAHSLPYPPLIISFECGYCPVGIFSALMVYFCNILRKRTQLLSGKYHMEQQFTETRSAFWLA